MLFSKDEIQYQDPLEYVSALLDLQNLLVFEKMIAELDGLSEKLNSCKHPNVDLLARGRALASNTLSKGTNFCGWDAAQVLISDALAKPFSSISVFAAAVNGILLENKSPSQIRTIPLFGADERYMDPDLIVSVMNALDSKLRQDGLDPRLKAFISYAVIVTVHPFLNANGRTARLMGDFYLMEAGWLPVCFLSPVQSHVAVTFGGRPRQISSSVQIFLAGVEQSYKFLLGQN